MSRKHWSTVARKRIRDRFDATCQMCRMPLGERGFDLDHHIPLAIGGDDTEENLRPLCLPCHRVKTRGDVGDIAKAKRREANHFGFRVPAQRGFRKAPPQNRASSPLSKTVNRYD